MDGDARNREELLGRLRKVEGQVRGIQRMVDQDQYCIDILTQIAAAGSALRKVAVALLDDHIRHCVADGQASANDRETKIAEATAAIDRLLKA
ncbi:MAG TPA: metal-sensitive transcriptional regulator [Actinomycetota bacterium]|jgi:DNA-binding FrmR family transcriptional regulator|nr:metal-sensitive transcriptional regulator [Actinomycetota bacterium]